MCHTSQCIKKYEINSKMNITQIEHLKIMIITKSELTENSSKLSFDLVATNGILALGFRFSCTLYVILLGVLQNIFMESWTQRWISISERKFRN